MGTRLHVRPATADAFKLHYYRQLLPNYESTLPSSTCAGLFADE